MNKFTVYHDCWDEDGKEFKALDEEDAVEMAAKFYYYRGDQGDPDKFNEVFKCNGKTYTVSAWTDINFVVTDDGEL